MNKILLSAMLSLALFGCAPMMKTPNQDFSLSYELSVHDVGNVPLEGAIVKYTLRGIDSTITEGTVATGQTGKVSISAVIPVDSRSYMTTFNYKVSKQGYVAYDDNAISNGSDYYNNISNNKISVQLFRPSDYINPSFLASQEFQSINLNMLSLIDDLIIQSRSSNTILQTKAIALSSFKDKSYLSFNLNSMTSYNSLRLNKYEIAKTLFDEVIRKTLNLIANNLAKTDAFYGYDITITGHTKNFTDKYAENQAIAYRFLMPKEVVNKYKQKDISGQQLLDSSVILMNDERIDLKLQ